MINIKKGFYFNLIFFILLFLIGCSSQQSSEETFTVGGAFALTGFGAGWGEVELNGVTLALEEINEKGGINGRKVELITEDIGQENTQAVSAVTKLIEIDAVDVIIGTTWLDTFGGAAPFADQHEIVMITPSSSIAAIKDVKDYQYVFSTWYRTDKEIAELVQHLDKHEVVLFFGNDPFWQDVVKNFKESIEGTGIEIVKEYKFTAGEVDFRTPIIQINDIDPDVVLFGLNDDAGVHAFLKQRTELDLEPVLYTTEYVEELAYKEDFEGLLERISFIAPKPLENDFARKYEERFDKKPLFSASTAYDAMHIIAQAVSEDSVSGKDMKAYLLDNEFDTVTFGTVHFDDIGGIAGGEFVIKDIINGKVEIKK